MSLTENEKRIKEQKRLKAREAEAKYRLRKKAGTVNKQSKTQADKDLKAKLRKEKAHERYVQKKLERDNLSSEEKKQILEEETVARYVRGYNNRDVPVGRKMGKYNLHWLNEQPTLPPKVQKIDKKIKQSTKIGETEYLIKKRIKAGYESNSEATIKKIISHLNGIYKSIYNKKRTGNYDWLKDTDKVIDGVLEKTDVISSQQSYFSTLSSVANALFEDKQYHDTYQEQSNNYMDKYVDDRDANELTVKQQDKIIDWNKFTGKRQPKSMNNKEYLFYLLLTQSGIPPRRKKAYDNMYIIDNKTKDTSKYPNYIRLNDNKKVEEIYISLYKTVNEYGIITRKKFPQKFNRKMTKLMDGMPLNVPIFKDINIGDITEKLLKKDTTLTLLRRSYVTNWFDNNPKATMRQIRTTASLLGHKPSTMLSYRVL